MLHCIDRREHSLPDTTSGKNRETNRTEYNYYLSTGEEEMINYSEMGDDNLCMPSNLEGRPEMECRPCCHFRDKVRGWTDMRE